MAEGPQVLLRTEWLRSWIGGKVAHLVESKRDDLTHQCRHATGRRIESVTCYGKHIFIDFGEDLVLHNHLLMKGRWRKYSGGFLFPPEQAWLVLDVGTSVVCNLEGQMLKWTDRSGRESVKASLGPDTLAHPYPRDEITARVRTSTLPISEALLDQSLVAGIGNIAKSEILYTAGLDPSRAASILTDGDWDRLHDRIQKILWESYDLGGRWIHRVYRKRGEPCPTCGAPIQMTRVAPSYRSTYHCPSCQGEAPLTLF